MLMLIEVLPSISSVISAAFPHQVLFGGGEFLCHQFLEIKVLDGKPTRS